MTPPRVFVTGATGYTGRHVVQHCTARGAATVAHVRPDSPQLDAWRRRFAELGAEVDTTPWTRDGMTATLRRLRPTHLFVLVGTTRARGRRAARAGRTETYETVDYALPHLLVEAARAAAAADPTLRPRLVYLSAVGARGDTRNAYLRVRGVVERELRESGLPWLSVRPSFITGGDRDEPRPLERVTATVVDTLLSLLSRAGARRLRDRYASLTAAQLAEGLVRVALAERGPGRIVDADELRGGG